MERRRQRAGNRPLDWRRGVLVEGDLMALENWPELRRNSSCGCGQSRTGERLVDTIATQSLSAALRHAQERWEGGDEFWISRGEAAAPRRTKPSRRARAAAKPAAAAARTTTASRPPKPDKVTIPAVDVSLGSAVSLSQLRKAKAKGSAVIAGDWRKKDKGLYVITAPGRFDRPIYVGEVRPEKKGTLLKRIFQHITGSAHKRGGKVSQELKQLHDLLSGRPVNLDGRKGVRLKPDDIYIQPAKIVPKRGSPIDFSTDPNHHGAELLLKGMLHPLLGQASLTFEYEAEDEEPEIAEAELRRLTDIVLTHLRSATAPKENAPCTL
jgi:hypothetical protein